MVTLSEMLMGGAVLEGEQYRVDKQIADLMKENTQVCRNLLNGLDLIENILKTEFNLRQIPAKEILTGINEKMAPLKDYLQARKIKIDLPEINVDNDVIVDQKMVLLAINELIINACKYTHDGAKISLFAQISQGYFCIAVKNDFLGESDKGIPVEYEKMVTESFFRLHSTVEGVGVNEDFPLGLGLAVVNYISLKHNGLFLIGNVVDHTGREPKNCVLAQFFVPYKQ